MNPTEILKHEHQIILLVLEGAEREAAALSSESPIDAKKIEDMIDLFRNFTDKCHHSKEENHLFPLMTKRGVPKEGGPIAVMLLEHEQGRKLVGAISEAVTQGDARTLAAKLKEYVKLLRAHIDKENNILFPMADKVLTTDDQKTLREAFDKVEAEEMGEGTHEKYHQLAHELAEK